MPRQINSPDELYHKHKRMIYQLIHHYAKDGHAAFDELESASNEVFTICFRKWDPSKGKFSTLLYHALTNKFKKELKKGEVRLRNDGEIVYRAREFETIDKGEWLMDILHILDEDARAVVARLLKLEATPSKKVMTAKEIREQLKKSLLRKTSWNNNKIKLAFRNIRAALKA
jgi:hypothetical protein